MIRTFRDKDTESIYDQRSCPRFRAIGQDALRKLQYLNAAQKLSDLVVPSPNRLEALKGDRRGQYSIRINDQWRVCFVWRDGDAYQVEITDYH